MKSLNRASVKTTKYLLANVDGVEIHLVVPSQSASDQKCFLNYKTSKINKYYGKGSVKERALRYFSEIDSGTRPSVVVSKLMEIFKDDIITITNDIRSQASPQDVTMNTEVVLALQRFYNYKELQRKEGSVSRGSLYGYKHHQRKLELYFNLRQNKGLKLTDLEASIWQNYRVHLLNNTYGFGKGTLKNSSVNQHFQYIHQFYSWLIDYLELPIKNHLKKLNKLSEAKGDRRFKVIDDDTLKEFYRILETYEKYYFTRLYLSALFLYENNVRLSEQVLIQSKDIDLDASTVRIINNKGSRSRLIKISPKVKELIEIIRDKTLRHGVEITDEMYLIGGHDMYKRGIPHGHKELAVVMRRFRKKYPQFAGRTLYEHKHTSITKQFNSGVDHYQIKQRADHSSIKTTEIYLEQSKVVKPFELKLDE